MEGLRVLVAEPLADEGIELLRKEAEVDVETGLDHDRLQGIIGDYDAVIVRSATRLDRGVIEAGTRLKVIGRAGVGVDNVDLEAATRHGITVVNAPQSNTLSAAEIALGLMLALARKIPSADQSVKQGRWERENFTGVELHGKTLGIVGLGRVGTLVAQRAYAFGMKLIAHDPFVSKARAAQLGIELTPNLDELLRQADFISIHVTKTADTVGLIGEREFSLMKPGVRIVNTSRGGIVDERALACGIDDGIVAGAALDVFESEPPGKSPLIPNPAVIATPHLGAYTEEAQKKAGTAIAEQVLLALKGEFAPYAVNLAAGAEFVEALRPFIPLTERLGRVLAGLAGTGTSSIHFEFHGALADHDTRVLTLAGLKGLFSAIVHEPVTYVNAPLLAEERGVEVRETKSARSPDFVNLVVLKASSDEETVAVGGTLVGKRDEARIVRVYEYEIDMEPARYMCFLRYEDRPGIIGKVGTVLGDAEINIAGMHVSRETIGGEALMGLTVDTPISPDVVDRIAVSIGARDAKFIDLGE